MRAKGKVPVRKTLPSPRRHVRGGWKRGNGAPCKHLCCRRGTPGCKGKQCKPSISSSDSVPRRVAQPSPHVPKGDTSTRASLPRLAQRSSASRAGREGMPVACRASLPSGSASASPDARLRNRPARSSSWYTGKKEGGKKMFSFQIIEPTVVKTSRLICMTCSMHSTLTNWWNILHS